MTEWGRDDRAGYWPPRWPQRSVLACVMALGVTAGCVWLQPRTPLQRYYLTDYLWSAAAASVRLPAFRYTLLLVGGRPAVDADVTAIVRAGVVLSPTARALGVTRVLATKTRHNNAAMRDWFQRWIFGQSVGALLLWPSVAGGAALLLGLFWSIPADKQRNRERRQGRRLRGPELVVKARQFSRRSLWTASYSTWSFLAAWWRQDGVSFQLSDGHRLVIPRVLESHHILITGDTGTGKSTLIENILDEVQRRGERAVVVDTKRRFAERYFNRERGDVILNPGDARWRNWNIGQEIDSDDEAMSIAMALLPEDLRETTGGFFTKAPRRILAYLLARYRPDTHDLVAWLKNGDVLDTQLIGSGLESILSGADGQRSGILAALSMIADTLQLCPPPDPSVGEWTAKEWTATGTGWVFLTSTESTLDRLVPLQTLWADSIIMRVMQYPNAPITWVVEDEVAVMNRQPKLHTALTRSRESGLRMVVGFQARAQMEARYGKDAEAMLSQPATKIFLRTSEPHSAKWVSETIGNVETERLKQSRQDGWARSSSTSFNLERHIEPLVMDSEISGFADLQGYLKIFNLVSPLRFPHVKRPAPNPGLVRRQPVPVRAVPEWPVPVPVVPIHATPVDLTDHDHIHEEV